MVGLIFQKKIKMYLLLWPQICDSSTNGGGALCENRRLLHNLFLIIGRFNTGSGQRGPMRRVRGRVGGVRQALRAPSKLAVSGIRYGVWGVMRGPNMAGALTLRLHLSNRLAEGCKFISEGRGRSKTGSSNSNVPEPIAFPFRSCSWNSQEFPVEDLPHHPPPEIGHVLLWRGQDMYSIPKG